MTANSQQIHSVERLCAVAGLILMVGAFAPVFQPYARVSVETLRQNYTDGNLEYQLVSGLVYLISIFALLPFYRTVLSLIRLNWVLFLFILFIILSPLWSEVPVASFRRSLALLGTTIFAVFLTIRFKQENLLQLMAIGLALTVVTSLFLVFFFPSIGLSVTHPGDWRGHGKRTEHR